MDPEPTPAHVRDADRVPRPLHDHPRYTVGALLGRGASRLVYEAYDRQRGATVAIKVLRSVGPEALYRLKQEFRALSDLSHPNLVQLYELEGSDEGWFLTMERVQGVDFYRHARGIAPPSASETHDAPEESAPTDPHHRGAIAPPTASPCPDPDRLQKALVQLLRGLATLHAAGKLHRDLKPSNVRVTPDGRVVLVDFGLVVDAHRSASEVSRVDQVLGTAAYVAPEVLLGAGPPSPAMDLYAVGVMLFQGLTGRLPFEGSLVTLLRAKQAREVPRPSHLVSGVPPALDALCAAWMAPDPADRPTAAEALLRLGEAPNQPETLPRAQAHLAGRETERRRLLDAFATTTRGRAVVAVVRGVSGIGKTSLIDHVLGELRQRADVTVLRGRCDAREHVPFHAFDALADGLRRRIEGRSAEARAHLLPPRAALLARLFPVLRDLIPLDPSEIVLDPIHLRIEAIRVSAELVRNLCRERPVVVFLDDVQWGDADSARLLAGWLKHLQHARLLVVLAHRTEDGDDSPFLSSLSADPIWARSETRTLDLQPLSTALAAEVARGMLVDDLPDPVGTSVWLADAAQGNPHLLAELAMTVNAAHRVGEVPVRPNLDALVWARVRALPPDALRLLRVVAVAWGPLPVRVLAHAAEVGEGALAEVTTLRAQRLVRTRQSPLGERIEPYHDRVCRAVPQGTPEEQARLHARLARALDAARWDDPEARMHHWLAAGDQERAAELAAHAARDAADALAFDTSARLFQTALGLGRWTPAAAEGLRLELADALVLAGRGAQAARMYLEAAGTAEPHAADALRRKAAEQLLRHGHLDEGLALLGDALRGVGLTMPSTTHRAAVGHLALRARLALRGTGFRSAPETEVTAQARQRIDTCWFVALSLALIDPVRSVYFHDRNLLDALAAGERYRVLRALAMELPMEAQRGGGEGDAWNHLLKRAKALAAKVGRAHGHGLVHLGEGMSAYVGGRFRHAVRLLKQAERTLQDVPDTPTEQGMARLYALRALTYTGELKTAQEQHARLLDDAVERGHLLFMANLRGDPFVLLHLAGDATDRVRSDLDAIRARWSSAGWHYPHWFALRGAIHLALYERRGATAWAEATQGWARARAARMHHNVLVDVMLHEMRGAAALGAGHTREAHGVARALLAKPHRLAAPFGHLVRGGALAADGDTRAASEAFARATDGFDRVEMALHAQVARVRHGALLGGADGEALTRSAEGWFANQGVADPAALCESILPTGR